MQQPEAADGKSLDGGRQARLGQQVVANPLDGSSSDFVLGAHSCVQDNRESLHPVSMQHCWSENLSYTVAWMSKDLLHLAGSAEPQQRCVT